MIADCSSGIEPTFALAWQKQNILEGKTLVYTNKYFETQAKERGFYSEELMDYLSQGGSLQDREEVPDDVKKVFITAPEISPQDHVKMQAAFQRHVDSGISKTINMPFDASVEDVMNTYKLAWLEGCKGITVYRAGSRKKEVLVKGTQEFKCCATPNIIHQDGCEKCLNCDWSACLIA
jgi:ribonucleoside-diphosphate reductase alpha chain